jgi:hypothetical protein
MGNKIDAEIFYGVYVYVVCIFFFFGQIIDKYRLFT